MTGVDKRHSWSVLSTKGKEKREAGDELGKKKHFTL